MYFVSCSPLTIELDPPAKRASERDAAANAPHRSMQYIGPRRLFAKFELSGSVPAYAREAVSRLPGFTTGLGPEDDPYLVRLCTWDSLVAQHQNGWSDEERGQAEQTLLASGDPNVMLVEAPMVAAPYPKYDEHRKVQGRRTIAHVIADIARTYEVAGFDLGAAVAYERQNLDDAAVVAALEALAGPVAEAAPVEELVKA